MRAIRQVLRLAHELGATTNAISLSLGVSRDTVSSYLTRAAAAGLSWPLPEGLDDAALEELLYPATLLRFTRKQDPDWGAVHRDMQRKGATLQVLHLEYLGQHPDGMQRSQFYRRYREWAKTLKPYLRQVHVAGERVFVDYAGPTLPVRDRATGQIRQAQIFVGVLGASNYTYAEAHWSQQLADWIGAHVRMFEAFGAVPLVVVCDNLKSGVTRASRTEPIVNASYQHMAEHYQLTVLPTRARQPKDKAKVEGGVLIVERWILFRLRKRVFTSLGELNQAIAELLADLNQRPFQNLPGSRASTFETVDKPAMRPLPDRPFEYVEFRRVRVDMGGMFDVNGRLYSAPAPLVRQVVDLRIGESVVEVLHGGRRAASHVLEPGTTPKVDPLHLTPAQRAFGLWTADAELEWARGVGAHVYDFLQRRMAGFKVKEQGYRFALGLKKLLAQVGAKRLDAACRRGLEIQATTLGSIRSILAHRLDTVPADASPTEAAFEHENVRGPKFYH